MEKTIALIPGDGIGPDVVAEAVNVLDAVAKKYGHKWNYTNVLAGGCAIDKFGKPLIVYKKTVAKNSEYATIVGIYTKRLSPGSPTRKGWDLIERIFHPIMEQHRDFRHFGQSGHQCSGYPAGGFPDLQPHKAGAGFARGAAHQGAASARHRLSSRHGAESPGDVLFAPAVI